MSCILSYGWRADLQKRVMLIIHSRQLFTYTFVTVFTQPRSRNIYCRWSIVVLVDVVGGCSSMWLKSSRSSHRFTAFSERPCLEEMVMCLRQILLRRNRDASVFSFHQQKWWNWEEGLLSVHSGWEGQYDKCIAGRGGALFCSALFYILIVIHLAIGQLHYCT